MMPGRLTTGIAVLAAVGVGSVAGALIAVPSLSGAQPFPNAIAVGAPSGSTSTTTPGKTFFKGPGNGLLEAAASALHLTPDQLWQKLSDGKTTIADVAKQQGVDVNTVIDAMVNADRDRISNIVNNPLPAKRFAPGNAPGAMLPFGPNIRLGIIGQGVDAAAQALGITPAELKTDLAKGMSIADIAKSKNIDVNKVIDALVADANAKIDAAVKSGELTQDRANTLKSMVRSAITALVNNTLPKLPAGPGGGFGFKFGDHHGFWPYGGPGFGRGPGSGAPTSSTTTTVKPATS
jgi:hypothetical protein